MADGTQRRQVLCHARNSFQTQNTTPVHTTQPNTHTCQTLQIPGSNPLRRPTWRTHVFNVVGDASRTLNFLRRTLIIASENTKALAYKALVRPKLEYAPSVWDPHHAKWRNALRRWHNTSSVTAMKHDLGWEALADRRQLRGVKLFYNIHHNLVLIPIPDYLTLNARPNRNRHHICYNIPNVNKDCLKFSFFVRTTRDWNLVPPGLMSHVHQPELFRSELEQDFILLARPPCMHITVVYTVSLVRSSDRVDTPGMTEAKSE